MNKPDGPGGRFPLIALIAGSFTMIILLSFFHLTTIHTSQLPLGSAHDGEVSESLPSQATPRDRFLLRPEEHVHRQPTTHHFTWNVTVEDRSPNGVVKPVYLINDEFPGPTIEVRSGDEVVIDVLNSITHSAFKDEGLGIHWHGLALRDANVMDGSVGITQRAIKTTESRQYKFRIGEEEHGTFWYHAHSAVQRADGLYGAFIVHRPSGRSARGPKTPMKEHVMLIGDWYHEKASDVFDWYMDPAHYGYEQAPDAALVNGQGMYNCSMAVQAHPVQCEDVLQPVLSLADHERVYLRIVNVGASAGFSLNFAQARVRVVAVDGGGETSLETPWSTAVGLLYPGERIDVIMERTQDDTSSDPALMVELDKENMKLLNYALDPKQHYPLEWKHKDQSVHVRHGLEEPDADTLDHFDLGSLVGKDVDASVNLDSAPLSQTSIYTLIYTSASTMRPTGVVNHTSWTIVDPDATPLLELERDQWKNAVELASSIQTLNVLTYETLGVHDFVDLEIHNLDDVGHPFHMHGHQFYVVAESAATAGGPDDSQMPSINTKTPLLKDTVYVPSQRSLTLRFSPSNPGLWVLHCHVLWHQAAGMAMLFQVGDLKTSGT